MNKTSLIEGLQETIAYKAGFSSEYLGGSYVVIAVDDWERCSDERKEAADALEAKDKDIERPQEEVAGLQFIINRSAELLQKGHRDEVEIYLTEASK